MTDPAPAGRTERQVTLLIAAAPSMAAELEILADWLEAKARTAALSGQPGAALDYRGRAHRIRRLLARCHGC